MCNPELSTNWYSDAKKLGAEFFPPIQSGIINSKRILDEYDLKSLRFLKLIGGEPLMEQDKFIDLLKRCDLPKLRILLATNTTIIPKPELVELLKQCKVVWVNLSVDAFGPLNEFLRKGSKWENVTNVIEWFGNTFPRNTKIHGIISIYNINNFYLLENYIHTHPTLWNKVSCEWQMVDGPNWMQPANLPKPVKEKIMKKIETLASPHAYNLVRTELEKEGDFKLFLDKDKKLNDLRNEDWKMLNTDLCEMLTEFL